MKLKEKKELMSVPDRFTETQGHRGVEIIVPLRETQGYRGVEITVTLRETQGYRGVEIIVPLRETQGHRGVEIIIPLRETQGYRVDKLLKYVFVISTFVTHSHPLRGDTLS